MPKDNSSYDAAAESRDDTGELNESLDFSEFPNCPRCGNMMSRVIYGMLAGPPPPHHVAGGCLLDSDSPEFECERCSADEPHL